MKRTCLFLVLVTFLLALAYGCFSKIYPDHVTPIKCSIYGNAVVSPDGKSLLITTKDNDSKWSLWCVQTSTKHARRIALASAKAICDPAWSANNECVSYVCGSEIKEWDGGRDTTRVIAYNAMSPVYSPDGKYLAYAKGRKSGSMQCDIWLLDRCSGKEQALNGGNVSPWLPYCLNWSPDSKLLAFLGSDLTSSDLQRIYAWKKDGDSWLLLKSPVNGLLRFSEIRWGKNSHTLDYVIPDEEPGIVTAVSWDIYKGSYRVIWHVKHPTITASFMSGTDDALLRIDKAGLLLIEKYSSISHNTSGWLSTCANIGESCCVEWGGEGKYAVIATMDKLLILDKSGHILDVIKASSLTSLAGL